MAEADGLPLDAINEVLSWLEDLYATTDNVSQRFYASLVIDLLYRPGGLLPGVDADVEALWYHTWGKYTVMFRWDRPSVAYQIEGLVIQRTDGMPFLASDLRTMRWRDLIDDDVQKRIKYTELLELRSETMAGYGTAPARKQWAEEGHDAYLAGRVESMAAPKRKRYDQEHYVEVARLYDEALDAGSRAPNRYIAEEFGVESTSTVKNWVVECRRLGLLPPTTERRPRGNPR